MIATEPTCKQQLTALKAKYNAELGLMIHKADLLMQKLQRLQKEIFKEPVLHPGEDFELESSGCLKLNH